MFYCPGNTRYRVMDVLEPFGGEFHKLAFSDRGVTTWEVK
jgi:D-glycero-alpha-D-manno-heptose-7-phosphate kinase